MRAVRSRPGDPADIARSVVPLALIVLAAAVPIARPFVLAGLVFGVAVAIRRDAPVRWAWAAPIPVAVSLCWGLLPVPAVSPSGADCASITSPTAVWRTAEAGVVIGAVAILAWALRSRPVDLRRDLLLRMPARAVVRWSIVGFLVAGPVALLLGPLAGPAVLRRDHLRRHDGRGDRAGVAVRRGERRRWRSSPTAARCWAGRPG